MKIRRKLRQLSLHGRISHGLTAIASTVVMLVATTLLIGSSMGCSSADKIDATTPEGAYKLAEDYEKDERFEESVQKYTDVKNKHPYSRFATLAEMRIADVQFKREAYIEAQFAYQTFKDLHPKHPQIDYVTFRLGLSIFNQLPSTTDRDLSLADKSILYFDEVLTSYSKSPHAKEAGEKKAEALRMLADKELYIANFYFKKKQYLSALGRYEGLLRTYGNVDGFGPPALYGAAVSAKETGDKDKQNRFVKTLISQYPRSSEAEKARSEFRDAR